MAKIYISIGSNIEREHNIRSSIAALKKGFGELLVSRVYESEAIGFEGDHFYNLVVATQTELDIPDVVRLLRDIESLHLRERSGSRYSSRTLDLDLLLYDDVIINEAELQLPRAEIIENAFVLAPLSEIAGEQRHPVLHQRYCDLWQAFDKNTQGIWPVKKM